MQINSKGFAVGVPISLRVGHITAEEVARRIYGDDFEKVAKAAEMIKESAQTPEEMMKVFGVAKALEFGRTYGGCHRELLKDLGVDVSENVKKRMETNVKLWTGGISNEN